MFIPLGFRDSVQGDAGIFVVTQREVEVLEALCGGSFEKVVQPALQIPLVG